MEITVRSSKIAKTGQNEKGAWSLVVVVADDSGIEYTTFDAKAHIDAGAILDIGEPIVKEGKHSFKKVVEIIKTPPVTSQDNDKPDMTPDMWNEKQRVERHSIETQVIFKGVVELLVSKIILTDNKLAKATLDWAMAHFEPSTSTQKPPPKPAQTTQCGSLPATNEFASVGVFYAACNEGFKFNKTQVENELGGHYDLGDPTGRVEAWAYLVRKLSGEVND